VREGREKRAARARMIGAKVFIFIKVFLFYQIIPQAKENTALS
jgi:hypothetical protein